MVKSFGGRISYEREDERPGSEDQSDASITHEIVDRPPEQLVRLATASDLIHDSPPLPQWFSPPPLTNTPPTAENVREQGVRAAAVGL